MPPETRMFESRMQHVVDGDYTPFGRRHFCQRFGARCDTAKALRFPLPLALRR